VKFIDFVALLATVCHLLLFIWAILCYRNFGKGLKNFSFLKAKAPPVNSINADDSETQRLISDVEDIQRNLQQL